MRTAPAALTTLAALTTACALTACSSSSTLGHGAAPVPPTSASPVVHVRTVTATATPTQSTPSAPAVAEQIYVYGSVTEAVRHQQIAERGLHCRVGRGPDGQAIRVGRKSVYYPHNRIDKIEAWPFTQARTTGALVLVRLHAVIVQLGFVAESGHQPHLSAQAVVTRALEKILKHAP